MDPLAAAKIVEFLKNQLQPQQGLLFASHRIDETIAVCNKVLLLFKGQKYIDGNISSFNEVAFKFYQVDVVITNFSCEATKKVNPGAFSSIYEFVDCIYDILNGMENVERVVVYSDNLVRFTFEKALVRLSSLWMRLAQFKQLAVIESYAFRLMDTEEVLSTIIANENVDFT